MNNYDDIPPCSVCGEHFDNIFEATDHLLEDDEEEFDPRLILSSGYSLMVGSLLRCMYSYADNPSKIKEITQSTYAALYAAENNTSEMRELVEDMIVREHMNDIDTQYESLTKKKKKNNDKGGE